MAARQFAADEAERAFENGFLIGAGGRIREKALSIPEPQHIGPCDEENQPQNPEETPGRESFHGAEPPCGCPAAGAVSLTYACAAGSPAGSAASSFGGALSGASATARRIAFQSKARRIRGNRR